MLLSSLNVPGVWVFGVLALVPTSAIYWASFGYLASAWKFGPYDNVATGETDPAPYLRLSSESARMRATEGEGTVSATLESGIRCWMRRT